MPRRDPWTETPRQRRIRHNWPTLCGSMTRQEKMNHVWGLRASAMQEKEPARRAELESAATSFERAHLKEKDWKK